MQLIQFLIFLTNTNNWPHTDVNKHLVDMTLIAVRF